MLIDYQRFFRASIEKLDAATQRIMADANLSDVGRKQALDKTLPPIAAESRQWATWWMENTRKAAETAEQTLKDAQKRADASVNTERRRLALAMATETATHGSWADVSAAIDQAVAKGDADALEAWRVLEPRLRSQFDARTGPQSDAQSGLTSSVTRLKQAIAAQEPYEIRTAAEAARRTAEAHEQARADIDHVDFARKLHGQPAMFGDLLHPVVVEAEGDYQSGYVMASGGAGPWGNG